MLELKRNVIFLIPSSLFIFRLFCLSSPEIDTHFQLKRSVRSYAHIISGNI